MGVVAKYSIKDLEILSGIRAATLRMWEKRYQIITPLRTHTNIRYYGNEHLKLLLNINVLNRNGIKISHIARMSHREITDKVKDLSFTRSGDDDLFDGLMLSMIDLDETLFQQAFFKAVARLGFEDTINRIIFPFFSRIGIMWQIDSINPAQEHFISNMVRQKLISAIDSINTTVHSSSKKVLLFLPENELHELGLLFFSYLIKNKGYQTIYLGQAVPLSDLPKIVEVSNPDIFVCNVSNPMTIGDIQLFISKLEVIPANKKLYIASANIAEQAPELPANFQLLASLKQLLVEF
ncbi:MerR family transcriptional regulator [Pedobacter chitinilyticus]|mgnify:CR=1 FL=1|uniref:MerR family transcriptional regulator n=1 Tax=Pedobacter chitinilyticus TaxID=2233776 RepID=A0A3S3PJ58_9SPHI|nr:MerR family transcriptional regulator [Pedobacter chitinilyticus]RWU10976.1 MerR family transcriptional regulator [Pedobacter chitinilyticus]